MDVISDDVNVAGKVRMFSSNSQYLLNIIKVYFMALIKFSSIAFPDLTNSQDGGWLKQSILFTS